MAQELKRLTKHVYLERATDITEDYFVSPAVTTVKKDKPVKNALHSRKLNEVTVKRKVQMPNMEELVSRRSREISGTDGEVSATTLDFDYAYGQIKLDEDTKTCVYLPLPKNDHSGNNLWLNIIENTGLPGTKYTRTDTRRIQIVPKAPLN